MKFLNCLCSCFRKTKGDPEPAQPNPAPEPVSSPKCQKITVNTKYRAEDIQINEFTPANTQVNVFRYDCPICFRFFSTILTLQCCKNYICHNCIADLSNNNQFEVACPHCKASPIYANDVDLASSVKRYSDSPYGTFKQSAKPGNKWVPMPIVEEDKEVYDDFGQPASLEIQRKGEDDTKMRLTV